MPMVAPARAKTMALDFTNLHTRQAKMRSASSASLGLRRVGTSSSAGERSATSRDCIRSPPPTERRSAGVRVLDDDARGVCELAHALDGRVRVRNVVEGEVLALQDARGGHPGAARGGLAVERRPLMGVLPVTQILRLLEHQLQGR